MESAREITRSVLLDSNTDAVLFLDSLGLTRYQQADALEIPRSALDNTVREESVVMNTLRSWRTWFLCIEKGYTDPIDRLLPEGWCLARIPNVQPNGCTQDEVLEGAELIGRTRFDSVRGDWRAVLGYGWLLIEVGWRLVMEAKKMLGHQIIATANPAMMPAPMFDHMGDGQ